jgi:hypothetical protein
VHYLWHGGQVSGDTAAPQVATSNGTNGTSAPQKPAPGVVTPTPTPKNGEGAVAKGPGIADTPPKPKNPWGDSSLKVPLKFKGKEEEVEFNSVDDLTRIAQKARLADSQGERANKAEAQLKAILEMGEDAFFKARGINPEEYVMKKAQEMLRLQEMSADQRAIETARQEAAAAKQQAASIQAEFQRLQQERAQEAQWQQEGPQWEAALKSRDRIGDKAYTELAANIAAFLVQNGIEATPEQICGEADEQWNKTAARYATGSPTRTFQAIAANLDPGEALKVLAPRLTPELLWGVLSDDAARRQVMAFGLAWHKGLKGTQTATQPPAQPRNRDQSGKYLTESEWRAKRDSMK